MFQKLEELKNIIVNGENSTVEFNEELSHNDSITKEIVAFLNFKGGVLIFGVSDDGMILGISEKHFEERIMNIFYQRIFPNVIPEYEELLIDDKRLALVRVEMGIDKPYYTKINGKNCYFIRMGSTSREASREELLRLFQSSGNIHFEVNPVFKARYKDLNFQKIEDYFEKYRNIVLTNFTEEERINILINCELLVREEEEVFPTIAGMLMFGKEPKKYLNSSGIRVMCIEGNELSDSVKDHKFFERDIFENIDNTLEYIKIRIENGIYVEAEAQRKETIGYPVKVIREILVNCFVHRDYTIIGSNIAVIIYDDRIEFRSPGGIPNSLNIEKIRQGIMYHRNPILVQFLYDAGYVERLGRGIRNSIEVMKKFNGTNIDILSDDGETVFILYCK